MTGMASAQEVAARDAATDRRPRPPYRSGSCARLAGRSQALCRSGTVGMRPKRSSCFFLTRRNDPAMRREGGWDRSRADDGTRALQPARRRQPTPVPLPFRSGRPVTLHRLRQGVASAPFTRRWARTSSSTRHGPASASGGRAHAGRPVDSGTDTPPFFFCTHAFFRRAEASPAEERGITVLGAPLGTDAYVQTQLTAVSDRQLRFLQVLPTLPDLQVAWLLLLYCASPRSNYALRMLPPNLTAGFASASDQAVQQCLYSLLNADNSGHLPQQAACLAQIALRHGGLGLRSAQLHAPAVFWASWADALPAVHRRDPELAAILSQQLAVPGACFPGRGPSRGCALGPMRL